MPGLRGLIIWGFFLGTRPVIAQCQGPIENRLAQARIRVDAKLSETLKLDGLPNLYVAERRLKMAAQEAG